MRIVTSRGDVLDQLDPNDVDLEPDAIVLMSCVRNESARLPYFMQYYRELGIDRFVFVDNNSDDGTAEFLLAQQDTHVFRTTASYAASTYGVEWLNHLATDFAVGHWVLTVDADELLVYPGSEDVGLAELTARMDARRRTGLLTFLLDMYADGPIRDAAYVPGTPFLETCPFFDTDGYTFGLRRHRRRVPFRGGARRRLFWGGEVPVSGAQPPFLPKIPLVRWSAERMYTASTHTIAGIRLARPTGALLHFKLFGDFVDDIETEVERAEHWQGGAQYAAYARVLGQDPDLSAMYEGSARFAGTGQLVDIGLMKPEK